MVSGVYGHSLVFDKNALKYPAEIKLVASDIEVVLNHLSEQLEKVKICISEWLDQMQQPKIQRVKVRTMVLSFPFQEIKPPAAAA
jgi:hypothetical protein